MPEGYEEYVVSRTLWERGSLRFMVSERIKVTMGVDDTPYLDTHEHVVNFDCREHEHIEFIEGKGWVVFRPEYPA